MITKTTDSKGRISLGKRYANRTFIIEETQDMELRLQPAAIIPESEMWLHKNTEARLSVVRGLEQAKAAGFSKSPPNLAADQELIEKLEDGQ